MRLCIGFALVLSVAVVGGCDRRRADPAQDEATDCASKQAQLIAKARALIGEQRPEEARALLVPCWRYAKDPEYKIVSDQASAIVAKKELDAIPQTDKEARYKALMQWRLYAKNMPPEYEQESKRLNAEVEAAMKRQDAILKKRQALEGEIAKLDFWAMCREAGQVLRTLPEKRQQPRADAVLSTARISPDDIGAVIGREVRIGMGECALAAALGPPVSMNRSVNTYGRSDQWVYRSGRYSYVYTRDGAVTSFQQ